ncbi:hypothetical protein L208DRAFT_1383097 [Tricholoma matsutake]|nr:hypothetical protein L208DRAFT_1383097 [Tricholoma matsutake 945]
MNLCSQVVQYCTHRHLLHLHETQNLVVVEVYMELPLEEKESKVLDHVGPKQTMKEVNLEKSPVVVVPVKWKIKVSSLEVVILPSSCSTKCNNELAIEDSNLTSWIKPKNSKIRSSKVYSRAQTGHDAITWNVIKPKTTVINKINGMFWGCGLKLVLDGIEP